jgi:glycosyltransferase involved in cell wall biosynthesis
MTVLHYTGYTHEEGGIVTVIRSLSAAGRFEVLHGVSPGADEGAASSLARWTGPAIAAEEISIRNFWRARAVALAVQAWLRAAPDRMFHGHSRAGLLVALWLHWLGETRIVASVHCYGRQRWFYRWAAGRLGERLFWLTPTMRRYYGVGGLGWTQCLPGGVDVTDVPLRGPGLPAGRLRLGGAGFLIPWKRWDLVVEALARLPAEVRDRVSFEHIGGNADGTTAEHAGYLRKLTTRHGLDGTVQWRGPEPSSRRLLQGIDALVVPSHQEPYSMILQEALAAGVPVIAADSGGPADVVLAGVNGTLFPDGDAAALAGLLAEWQRNFPAFDPATIRTTARRADEVAARWAEVYGRL